MALHSCEYFQFSKGVICFGRVWPRSGRVFCHFLRSLSAARLGQRGQTWPIVFLSVHPR